MRMRIRLAAAALLIVPVLAGCSADDGPTTPAVSGDPVENRFLLVEGDTAGYITFDTEQEKLTGFRSDGTRAWTHSGNFPSDIQCLNQCPDAVISAPVSENPGQKKSLAIWKYRGETTVKEFAAGRLDVHWSSGPDNWIATVGPSVTWSDGAGKRSLDLPGELKDSMGTQSADGRSLAVSVATGDEAAPRWSAYLFDVPGRTPGSPRLAVDHLPGSVGCLDPAADRAATIGEKPALFTLGSGRRVRDLGDFSSECAMSRSTTVFGTYAVGQAEQDAQAVRVTGNTGNRTSQAGTSSGGGLGATSGCGVFLSEGRIAAMPPTGGAERSEVRAVGLRVLPDGDVYALAADGTVTRHRVVTAGSGCSVSSSGSGR
ncbi:hypothetical protein [Streptomyces sp. NPDC058548]|uniref:hypothetical protein n=1 Tax=Streptomyces sp. NPDC058548 TaxID=3346545 RepID=UPI0036555293